ncbi:DUF6069 family protein [Actinophytocola sp.]|uniref:DUF6069 family protein n=1 Tax=Actinophytocola sp. TaxID=1872138 RepID=UPI002ED609FF
MSAKAVTRPTVLWIAGGVAVAAVAAVAANALISLLAQAVGASDQFQPLQPSAYVFLTVVGVLAGAAGWAAVRRWSRRPAAVLRTLVPVVVAVSLLPDLALLFTDAQPNTSVLAVIALMLMHVATAAVAVPIFARVLPLDS